MKQKQLLFFLVPTAIVVIAWVGFNIYHSATVSTIPDSVSIQISPIPGQFNVAVINKLKLRQKIPALYEIPTSPTPSPRITPSLKGPSPLQSKILKTPTPATSSGKLR